VRVVAIATGPFTIDELREADAVARDAGELGALLDELLDRERTSRPTLQR
jgi:bacterioferritin-associated ferredoxin